MLDFPPQAELHGYAEVEIHVHFQINVDLIVTLYIIAADCCAKTKFNLVLISSLRANKPSSISIRRIRKGFHVALPALIESSKRHLAVCLHAFTGIPSIRSNLWK